MTRTMANNDPKELERRIRELEEENARLKDASDPDKLVITEGEYNGYPVLTFQRGSSRPFSLGMKKLEAVRDVVEEIKGFLARHGVSQGEDASDLQI